MKLMFASDIHGSAFYCRRMLELYKNSGAKRLVLLGDILYHGPRNDLPREYAPKEVIAMLIPLKMNFWRCAETATPRWTRWCWSSRFWRTTVSCWWGKRASTPPTAMCTTRTICRH